MLRGDATQAARSPLALLSYAEQHGLNRNELMEAASLSATDLADPDSRTPVASMQKLWRAVLSQHNDPLLGLNVGKTVTAERLGLLGYMMNFSDHLLDALLHLSRYGRLVSDAWQCHIIRERDSVSVRLELRPYMVALRHPVDAAMASILAVAREITQTEVSPQEVRLISPPPDSVEPYRSVFKCVVTFGRPDAEMVFTPQQMETPVVARDEMLVAYLDELATSKLQVLGEPDTGFIDRVRGAIWNTLQRGKPSLVRTAADLGISGRTLQRRLGQCGTSFSRVLEELRRELSEELRRDKGFAASEVAFLLGYSEPSAYQRALRRWRTENRKAS
jgi:AraC-like DNA-binding protein